MKTPLVVIGVVSVLGQVLVLRELSVAFFGVELVILLAIGLWLLASGLGALLGHRRWPAGPGKVALLLMATACLLPGELVFLRVARVLLGATPGGFLPLERGVMVLILAGCPLALGLGLLFQLAARLHVAAQGTLAGAYALESLGGLAGGLAASLGLWAGWPPLALAAVCGLLALASAWPVVPGRRGGRWLIAGLALPLALALPAAADLELGLTRVSHPDLVASHDSPYGRLTLTRRLGQTALYLNDALLFESEGAEAEVFAHLAALQVPKPQRVLLLGGGLEALASELLRHKPERITLVELDAPLFERARGWLPAEVSSALSQVHIVFSDPRAFLSRPDRFDLILVALPEPDSGQANRFYTREFFTGCRAHLSAEGVLGLRLRSAENYWTEPLARRMASIERGLRAVFADVLVLPGTVNIVVAGRAPLERDPDVLGARLRMRGITGALITPRYVRYLYTNARLGELQARLDREDVPANTDDRPVCYAYTMALWLERFLPGLARAGPGLGSSLPGPLALLALGALWLARRSRAARPVAFVFVAGFVGMAGECVVLLHFQAKQGVLFERIGLLLALFMAGLAIGARVGQGLGAGGADIGRGLLLGFIVSGALTIGLLRIELPGGGMMAAAGGMMLVWGSLVGGALAWASSGADQGRWVGPLYAADLWGGCLAAVGASLWAIPFLGLSLTTIGASGLALAALLLVEAPQA